MAFQILLNFILAFVWMFLKTSYSPASFFVGYFFGLLIIYIFRRFFTSRFYLLRVVAVLNLIYIFTLELILSNISVLKAVLRPKLNIKPGIFAFPTELKEDWEITMLANLITLTPGTLVVDVSPDNRILYVHAMDISDADEAIQSIKNTFEKAIMEVSR
ncbi:MULTISPECIES: Na+/H+ antiporter subunit E [Bacillaceae]|uniref:Na+/H+ antiporter subunit E n=1 Tax=Bacillaceae TaxID=186817 RepID=UPI00177E3823|nr:MULTISPECIES: Na+/H+ antiporter subunit E [Bacillaceae]MBT2659432.1 Na+/H+ antiporter subunit E [Bacillus sp. ISL-45]MCM3576189.1 Na+/H+ antiporter subunit E [Mesobacillus subterraneus]UYZ21371.1 Na+/H+ antiporter subunit E [Mesobacillus jeotgali]